MNLQLWQAFHNHIRLQAHRDHPLVLRRTIGAAKQFGDGPDEIGKGLEVAVAHAVRRLKLPAEAEFAILDFPNFHLGPEAVIGSMCGIAAFLAFRLAGGAVGGEDVLERGHWEKGR
ncbi:MAG: hypothetical protein K9M97_07060 [Akkermansiaceae bacterium]|nr:hypothetical protein [Akkermansiaceae bacterium]